MVPGLKHTAYRVDKANWRIFYGNSAATLTLNGDGLPGVGFRCAITVTSITGHADCAGTVTVGAEIKTFTVSGQKLTTTTVLSALPVITTSGLDCYILIEAVNAAAGPILKETLTAIACRWMNVQKSYRDSLGAWAVSMAQCLTADTGLDAGDTIRYSSVDYTIKQVEAYSKLSGREFLRKLWIG